MTAQGQFKFSGYKWLGDIPSDWNITRIKNILSNVSIKNRPDATVLSLYREHGVIPKDSRDDNHNVTSEDTSSYKFVEIGNLVINKMKAWQGSLAVSDYEGIISPAYYVCKFIDDSVEKKYIHYLLRCRLYAQEFERLSTGMRVGQWDLGIDDFMCIPALIPPKNEQIAISNYLDRWSEQIDSIINESIQSIDSYRILKAAIIFEATTKGLHQETPCKNSGIEWIGDTPSHWSIRRLYQLVGQVKNKNTDTRETNLLSLSYGKIKRKDINTSDGLLPASFDGYNIIEAGDIVLRLTDLQNDHTSLRVGLSQERGIITSAYTTIRPFNLAHSNYLYYLLHTFDLRKGFYGMGAGVRQGLNYDEVKELRLVLPPETEQAEICAYLNEKCNVIDSLISEKESLIEDLMQYKKSLIYEVVTGKRKVV